MKRPSTSEDADDSANKVTKHAKASTPATPVVKDWRRPPCPKIDPAHTPMTFQIVDIDMYDGKPLPANPSIDSTTGFPKERPGMTQPNSTVRLMFVCVGSKKIMLKHADN